MTQAGRVWPLWISGASITAACAVRVGLIASEKTVPKTSVSAAWLSAGDADTVAKLASDFIAERREKRPKSVVLTHVASKLKESFSAETLRVQAGPKKKLMRCAQG